MAEDEEQREHALLSPSSAHRWLTCTPSARLEAEEGEGDGKQSPHAEEGTTAHKLAEIILSHKYGKITEEVYHKMYNDLIASDTGNKWYNEEFREYVIEHVNKVVDITTNLEKLNINYHIFFEVSVNISNFVPQSWGTVDVLIVTEDTIYIIDLKFGKGVLVKAINNEQLRLYGIGALNLFPNSKKVVMMINQPRLDNWDQEELTKQELLQWSKECVLEPAEKAIKGEGNFVPTPDGCRFCKIAGKCRARAEMNNKEAARVFSMIPVPEMLPTIDLDKLSQILDFGPLFTKWLEDVNKYAYELALKGVRIPGFKLVEGRSNRVMTDEASIKTLLQKEGYNEQQFMTQPKLLGISKLEELVGKKRFAEICKDFLMKPQGAITLAPESDRRPEFSTAASAATVFAEHIAEQNENKENT